MISGGYNGILYLFGGKNMCYNLLFEDIIEYDTKTSKWSISFSKGKGPCGRKRHISLVIGNKIYLYGVASPVTHQPRINLCKLEDYNNIHVIDLGKKYVHCSILSFNL